MRSLISWKKQKFLCCDRLFEKIEIGRSPLVNYLGQFDNLNGSYFVFAGANVLGNISAIMQVSMAFMLDNSAVS